jgi:hypothetical protein
MVKLKPKLTIAPVLPLEAASTDPAYRTVVQLCTLGGTLAARDGYTHGLLVLYRHNDGGTDRAMLLAGDTKRLELLGLLEAVKHDYLHPEDEL